MDNRMNEKCRICEGIGWLREEKGVNDEGFGQLVPCVCNHKEIDRLESLKPAPVPELHPGQLRWIEYTE